VYLWRKTAELRWVKGHEDLLQAYSGGQLVIVCRPGRKRLELEIVCRSRSNSTALLRRFGGQAQILPRNWLKRSARVDSRPIKVGKRLIIGNVKGILASRQSSPKRCSRLIIPASLAFGTGQHVTTAMSLRVLEQLTRRWRLGWSLLDLGTGSGILALAAKCFGAGHVTGIDNDPVAISVAKSNARLNKIRNVSFQFADVRKPDWRQETDLITANLYSDLLIEILPKLNAPGWLILSGILRRQQDELARTLQQSQYEIVSTKCRGKWMAILARRRATLRPELKSGKFLRQ
jgi:ribosomal protein L11 methyltransferase